MWEELWVRAGQLTLTSNLHFELTYLLWLVLMTLLANFSCFFFSHVSLYGSFLSLY